MCTAYPVTPPHPSFHGGDEITEIPSLEVERLIIEGIKRNERQLERDRRNTAGQTELQGITQTDRGHR